MKGFTHEKVKTREASNVEWYTPPWLVRAFGVEFYFDPASPKRPLPWIKTDLRYTKADDGLSQPWPSGKLGLLNHPYGFNDQQWLEKAADHMDIIGIVHARTDTVAIQSLLASGMVCVFTSRIPFVDRTGKPPKGKDGKNVGPPVGQILYTGCEEGEAAIQRALKACKFKTAEHPALRGVPMLRV